MGDILYEPGYRSVNTSSTFTGPEAFAVALSEQQGKVIVGVKKVEGTWSAEPYAWYNQAGTILELLACPCYSYKSAEAWLAGSAFWIDGPTGFWQAQLEMFGSCDSLAYEGYFFSPEEIEEQEKRYQARKLEIQNARASQEREDKIRKERSRLCFEKLYGDAWYWADRNEFMITVWRAIAEMKLQKWVDDGMKTNHAQSPLSFPGLAWEKGNVAVIAGCLAMGFSEQEAVEVIASASAEDLEDLVALGQANIHCPGGKLWELFSK